MIAAFLLMAQVVLAVSIQDNVLSWLRGEWTALAQARRVSEAFPEAEMLFAVEQCETFEDLIGHLQDSPELRWAAFMMALGRAVPAAVTIFLVSRLRNAINEARAAEVAQAHHPQTSCIVICARGNSEDELPPAVGCVPQPRIGDGPIRFGRAPRRAQLVPVQGLPALGDLRNAWATAGGMAPVQVSELGWLKVATIEVVNDLHVLHMGCEQSVRVRSPVTYLTTGDLVIKSSSDALTVDMLEQAGARNSPP